MESIGTILTSPTVAAIGWTVVHSLWQISVIVLLYYFISVYGTAQKSRHKYVLAYSVLLLQLVISITTFFMLYQPEIEKGLATNDSAVISDIYVILADANPVGVVEQIRLFLEPSLPLIVSLWMIGMVFFFVRMLFGYLFWYRIKHKNTFPLPEAWQSIFQRVKNRMKINSQVEVAFSSMITSPVLVGYLKPIILIPIALVNQLTTAQVEGILTHELAHLRRYDYVLNVIQLLIESIFYYHPAIWWLGQQIRSLREDCADDLVLEYTNDSVTYARTLLRVAEHSQVSHQSLIMGLLGHNKKQLLTRIQRILQQPIKQADMREKFAVTSILLLLAVVISLGAAWSSPNIDDSEISPAQIVIDTLPHGNIQMNMEQDGESMNVKLKDGEIQELSINGEVISPTEFAQYEAKVEEVLGAVPPPPPPAMSPPSPPSPPNPPFIKKGKKVHKIKIDNGDQVQLIIEQLSKDGAEYIWLKQADGEDGFKFHIGSPSEMEDLFIHSMDDMNQWVDSLNEEISENIWIVDPQEFIFLNGNEDGDSLFMFDGKKIFDFNFEGFNGVLDAHEIAERALIEAELATQGLELEERRAEIEARMEERQQAIEVAMEEAREKMEERMVRVEERRVQMEERVAKRHEEVKKRVEREVKKSKWLELELLRDGLIDDEKNYSLKLNSKRLKINGKTASDEMHEKYMNLYGKHRGLDFSGNTSISVTKKDDNN